MQRIKDLIILKPLSEKMCVITARFWRWSWFHWGGFHRAYDFASLKEFLFRVHEPVAGIRSRVEQVYNDLNGFGNYVKLQSLEFPQLIGYKAHLKAVYVREGDIVEAKQKIGIVGATGRCYSSYGGNPEHLHDEWRWYAGRGNYKKIDAGNYYKSWDYENEAFRA